MHLINIAFLFAQCEWSLTKVLAPLVLVDGVRYVRHGVNRRQETLLVRVFLFCRLDNDKTL